MLDKETTKPESPLGSRFRADIDDLFERWDSSGGPGLHASTESESPARGAHAAEDGDSSGTPPEGPSCPQR